MKPLHYLLALCLLAAAAYTSPTAQAQGPCMGPGCQPVQLQGMPQTLWRPQVTMQPYQYQGSVPRVYSAPLRQWAGGPNYYPSPVRRFFFGHWQHQYAPPQQAGQ